MDSEINNWLAQIEADPTDTLTPSVFADWLQDRDDDRAEDVRRGDYSRFPLLTVERPKRFRQKWEVTLPTVRVSRLNRPFLLLKNVGQVPYKSEVTVKVVERAAVRFRLATVDGTGALWSQTMQKTLDQLYLIPEDSMKLFSGNGCRFGPITCFCNTAHWLVMSPPGRVNVKVVLTRTTEMTWWLP